MVTATCVEKIRDYNGKITHYLLMDNNGVKKSIDANTLKCSINAGEISVDNLTLTSDNRLVSKTCLDRLSDAEETDRIRELTDMRGQAAQRLHSMLNGVSSEQISLENYNAEQANKLANFYNGLTTEEKLEKDESKFNDYLTKSDLTKSEFLRLLKATDGESNEEKINSLLGLIEEILNNYEYSSAKYISYKTVKNVRLHIKTNPKYLGLLSNDLNKSVDISDISRLMGMSNEELDEQLTKAGYQKSDLYKMFCEIKADTRLEKARKLRDRIELKTYTKEKRSIFNMFKR